MKISELPKGWVKVKGKAEYRREHSDGSASLVVKSLGGGRGWSPAMEGRPAYSNYNTAKDAIAFAERCRCF